MRAVAGTQRRHSLVWVQGLGCGAVVALFPATAVLLGVMLLPGVLAILYDRQGGRPVARTVLLCGAAATVTPMLSLWAAGNTIDGCMALLGELRVVGTAWSMAAGGWILAELAPVAVLVVLEAIAQTHAVRLRAERDRLVAEWGFERPEQ